MTLDLGLETKKTKNGTIWTWTVLEVIVAGPNVIAEPWQVVTDKDKFFSLWYINSYLHIRKRHWNRIRIINSLHCLYKSKSIILGWDLKTIPASLRNILKKSPNTKSNPQNGRELLNRIILKKVLLNKVCKIQ